MEPVRKAALAKAKIFKCKHCQEEFKTPYELSKHLKVCQANKGKVALGKAKSAVKPGITLDSYLW